MILDKNRVKDIFTNNIIKLTDIVIILDCECNADCKICVAKHVIKNPSCVSSCNAFTKECLRCCERVVSDESFYSSLEDIFSVINGLNVRVTISGGEPTISKRLLQTLKILDKYTFMEICIETNGARLLNEEIYNELIKRNVKIILSRYGVTDNENYKIFNFNYNVVSGRDIETIIEKYKNLLSISCIPLKSCVDSAEKLLMFYDHFKSLGVNNITFTEVMFDESLIQSNKEIGEYCKENKVEINQLSNELNQNNILKVYESGESFRLIKHKYDDDEIILISADMSKIAYETQNNNNYSKYLIYPSGEIGVHIENR